VSCEAFGVEGNEVWGLKSRKLDGKLEQLISKSSKINLSYLEGTHEWLKRVIVRWLSRKSYETRSLSVYQRSLSFFLFSKVLKS
jgi:hypothetical protein